MSVNAWDNFDPDYPYWVDFEYLWIEQISDSESKYFDPDYKY